MVLPLGIGIVFGVLLLNNYGKYVPRRRAIEVGLAALGVLLVILTVAGPVSRILTGVGGKVPLVTFRPDLARRGDRRDRLRGRDRLRHRRHLGPGPAAGGHPGGGSRPRLRRAEHAHLGREHPADHHRRAHRRPRRDHGRDPHRRGARLHLGHDLDRDARPDPGGRGSGPDPGDRRGLAAARSDGLEPAASALSRTATTSAGTRCEPRRRHLHRRHDLDGRRRRRRREGADARRRRDPRPGAGHRGARGPRPDRPRPHAREPFLVPRSCSRSQARFALPRRIRPSTASSWSRARM